jgi:hypothetical protein
MLFDYLYILNEFEPAFFNNAGLTGNFIIPVNEKVMRDYPKLFQILFKSANGFCFSLTDNLAGADRLFIQQHIVQNFVRLLFLPNYLRTERTHIFFIDTAIGNGEALFATAGILQEELARQGIDIALMEPQRPEMAATSINNRIQPAVEHAALNDFLAAEDTQSNFEKFTKGFWLPPHFEKKWIIRVNGPEDFCRKKKQLDKFELWLKGTQSGKVQLIEMLNVAASSNSLLKAENKLLAFKLENSAYYLRLIREESMGLVHEIGKLKSDPQRGASPGGDPSMQGYAGDFELVAHYQKVLLEERKRADDTFNWYQKEYEVLPRWFKRIGQLIRVLMGKRSFASLFNKSTHDQGRKNTA